MSRHIRSTALYRPAVGIHRADGPRRGGSAYENGRRAIGLSCGCGPGSRGRGFGRPLGPHGATSLRFRALRCAIDRHTATVKVVALLGDATLPRTVCAVAPGPNKIAARELGDGS